MEHNQKLNLKDMLEFFISNPNISCTSDMDCKICVIRKECSSWSSYTAKMKPKSTFKEYRHEQSILYYKKIYGEEAIFDLLL